MVSKKAEEKQIQKITRQLKDCIKPRPDQKHIFVPRHLTHLIHKVQARRCSVD